MTYKIENGQTLDLLTTDADIEAVEGLEATADVEAETAAVPMITDTVVEWDYIDCQ